MCHLGSNESECIGDSERTRQASNGFATTTENSAANHCFDLALGLAKARDSLAHLP
jgi:hypothetical protein